MMLENGDSFPISFPTTIWHEGEQMQLSMPPPRAARIPPFFPRPVRKLGTVHATRLADSELRIT